MQNCKKNSRCNNYKHHVFSKYGIGVWLYRINEGSEKNKEVDKQLKKMTRYYCIEKHLVLKANLNDKTYRPEREERIKAELRFKLLEKDPMYFLFNKHNETVIISLLKQHESLIYCYRTVTLTMKKIILLLFQYSVIFVDD
jgi:hypothetical protein